MTLSGKPLRLYAAAEDVKAGTRELAARISDELGPIPDVVVVAIAKGGIWFAVELMKGLPKSWTFDIAVARSYEGKEGKDVVASHLPYQTAIHEKTVLLVDDIVDRGKTMSFMQKQMFESGAKRVLTASLVKREDSRWAWSAERWAPAPDYHVFSEREHFFFVGCGMDWNGAGRNLSALWVLEEPA